MGCTDQNPFLKCSGHLKKMELKDFKLGRTGADQCLLDYRTTVLMNSQQLQLSIQEQAANTPLWRNPTPRQGAVVNGFWNESVFLKYVGPSKLTRYHWVPITINTHMHTHTRAHMHARTINWTQWDDEN